MENRITALFDSGKDRILNIYFTAGYPALGDTRVMLKALQDSGADMVEIGMPYSDPLADGPTIQASSEQALANGMSIRVLLEQLKGVREEIDLPIILMGYINPVLQFGMDRFLDEIKDIGIDGLILPDLPYQEYNAMYKDAFESRDLSNIFLVSPQTADMRLQEIDETSKGFIYVVSSNSTTGNAAKENAAVDGYFERIQAAGLKNPTLIGFNIKDKTSFDNACEYARGAIIGSAFIKALNNEKLALKERVSQFVKSIKSE